MANVDAIIQEGVAAIKAGRKDDAKRVLMRAIDLDERSEQAWLWLSACVDTPEEQQICLENVLSINPGNQKARKGIEAITKQRGQAPQPPAAPGRTPAAPAGGNPFGDNPFAGTGFDSNPYAASSTPDPALGSGWEPFGAGDPFGSAPAASDPFASSSSVDWGKPDAPAAYGSGKDVPAPSAEEYDNWVSNLQLGGNSRSPSPSSGPAFSAPPAASNPFGDAGFDSNSFDSGGFDNNSFDSGSFDNAGFDNPFGAPAASSPAPAPSFGDFGGGSSAFGDSPFGGATFDDSPFGSASNPPANNTPFDNSAFDSSAFDSPAFDAGPFGKSSAPTGSVPAFDSSDFGDTSFDTSGFDSGFGSGPFGTAAPSAPEPSSFSNAPMKSAALNRPASPAPDPFGGSSYNSGSASGFDDPVDNLFNNVPGTKTRNDTFGGSRTDPFANASLEQYTKPPDIEKDNLEDLFAPLDNKGKPEPRRATSTMAGFRNYFADIPAEIQMKGKTSPRMALTVGVLALLNAVSLALLVLNVMKH